MIWTDNWGQRPIGNIVDTVTIGGHEYQVWRSVPATVACSPTSTTPQLSGDMPQSEFSKMFRTAAGKPPRPGRLITASRLSTRTAARNGSTSPTRHNRLIWEARPNTGRSPVPRADHFQGDAPPGRQLPRSPFYIPALNARQLSSLPRCLRRSSQRPQVSPAAGRRGDAFRRRTGPASAPPPPRPQR